MGLADVAGSKFQWASGPESVAYWSVFEKMFVVGLADFAGSKFLRMTIWPSFETAGDFF